MGNRAKAIAFVAIIILVSMVWGVAQAAEKGDLYVLSERKTLSLRAGIPCIENENNFCHRNYMCKDGDVARGIVVHMDESGDKAMPSGFGLICSNPNEIYSTYQTGAIGDGFSGKEYRDACDVGFYLVGAKFYTDDKKTINGVKSVCRKYWPIEQRESASTLGGGIENMPLTCDEDKFVIGSQVSFSRAFEKPEGEEDTEKTENTEAKNVEEEINDTAVPGEGKILTTGLFSVRFYCAEIREYLSKPKKKKRDDKKGTTYKGNY